MDGLGSDGVDGTREEAAGDHALLVARDSAAATVLVQPPSAHPPLPAAASVRRRPTHAKHLECKRSFAICASRANGTRRRCCRRTALDSRYVTWLISWLISWLLIWLISWAVGGGTQSLIAFSPGVDLGTLGASTEQAMLAPAMPAPCRAQQLPQPSSSPAPPAPQPQRPPAPSGPAPFFGL